MTDLHALLAPPPAPVSDPLAPPPPAPTLRAQWPQLMSKLTALTVHITKLRSLLSTRPASADRSRGESDRALRAACTLLVPGAATGFSWRWFAQGEFSDSVRAKEHLADLYIVAEAAIPKSARNADGDEEDPDAHVAAATELEGYLPSYPIPQPLALALGLLQPPLPPAAAAELTAAAAAAPAAASAASAAAAAAAAATPGGVVTREMLMSAVADLYQRVNNFNNVCCTLVDGLETAWGAGPNSGAGADAGSADARSSAEDTAVPVLVTAAAVAGPEVTIHEAAHVLREMMMMMHTGAGLKGGFD